jgi:large subunit ribosomal protein L1
MKRHGKAYREKSLLIDRSQSYSPQEAMVLVKEVARANFDETVELHLRMGADPKKADQTIRGVVLLPHGLGKQIRVLVFAAGEAAAVGRDAGADYVGSDDLIQQIEGGWLEFDTALATPDMMVRVGRLGRVLGRRGLMPNLRTGSVVEPENLPRVIQESKMGRVEYRMDRSALIHCAIGKCSFTAAQLLENLSSLIVNIQHQRPSGLKGQFLRNAFLTTTMGPSLRLDLPSLASLKAE